MCSKCTLSAPQAYGQFDVHCCLKLQFYLNHPLRLVESSIDCPILNPKSGLLLDPECSRLPFVEIWASFLWLWCPSNQSYFYSILSAPFVQTLALRLLQGQTRDTPLVTSKFSICHLDSLIWEKSSWRRCMVYFQLHLISGRTGMYGRMRLREWGQKTSSPQDRWQLLEQIIRPQGICNIGDFCRMPWCRGRGEVQMGGSVEMP